MVLLDHCLMQPSSFCVLFSNHCFRNLICECKNVCTYIHDIYFSFQTEKKSKPKLKLKKTNEASKNTASPNTSMHFKSESEIPAPHTRILKLSAEKRKVSYQVSSLGSFLGFYGKEELSGGGQ